MNRDRGLINRVVGMFNDNPTSEASLYDAATQKMADSARQTDLIQRAQEHTTFVLTGMLKSMGFEKIDIVFHQAAYGGYMPEIAKYVHVNSLGTAQLLEVIREKKLPIKKIVVASSQAVYSEGAGECPNHGLVFPLVRPVEQLRKGDWQVHCPICGAITKSVPTPENAPVGGETVYGLTKVDQERLVLLWGKQIGIPTMALRYSWGPVICHRDQWQALDTLVQIRHQVRNRCASQLVGIRLI